MIVLWRSWLEFRIAISSEKGEIDVQKPARYRYKDSTVKGASFFMVFFETANLISENKWVVVKNFLLI